MKIFQVQETIQNSDSDGWQHWIEHEQISLHSSLENAENKIQTLLNKRIAEISKLRELNPGTPEKHWKELAQNLSKNRDYFTQACNAERFSKYPLYTIKEINLED